MIRGCQNVGGEGDAKKSEVKWKDAEKIIRVKKDKGEGRLHERSKRDLQKRNAAYRRVIKKTMRGNISKMLSITGY